MKAHAAREALWTAVWCVALAVTGSPEAATPRGEARASGQAGAAARESRAPTPKGAKLAAAAPGVSRGASGASAEGSAGGDPTVLSPEERAREARAAAKREEQIEAAKRIIPKIDDANPQKADLLFQLSELYWEKYRVLYRAEMGRYFQAQREAVKGRPDPVADHRESELFRSETMRLYEDILRKYADYERRDEVLFNLAQNLYDTGRRDDALKRYEELLKSFPSSRFAPDAYVQLGNHFFEVANVLAKARGYYEKAFATPSPRIKSYALYKLAWCDVNAGDHEGALVKLHETIAIAEGQGSERAFVDLKNEALQDLVRVYVALDRAPDAVAYYRSHAGKKREAVLLGKLAYALQDAGHHASAVETFKLLLAEAPTAANAPDLQQAVIKSHEAMRRRDLVRAEVQRLAELYRPGSAWWSANASRKEVLRGGFQVSEEAMRTIVVEYHQEAQKTKDVETYRLARDIYRQYLEAFASSEDDAFVADQAFNLRFYYAEILWALEEWEPAARAYDAVVTAKIPARPEAVEASNEKYRQQAAYNAILASDKLVKVERGLLRGGTIEESARVDEGRRKGAVDKQAKLERRSTKELQEKALTEHERGLVEACDRYNALFPKTADEVDVAYQAAVVYYDKNHFVEAARRFGEVINRHPEERRSQEAADLSMAMLEEREEWLELNRLSRSFLANGRLTKPGTDFARRIAAIVEGSQYKYVDEVVYKRENDAARAVALFVGFAKEFPKSESADRALTYAMLISRDAGRRDEAFALGERLLREYPESIFDLKVRFALAKLAEQRGDFARAAALYEAFVAAFDLAREAPGKPTAGRRGKTPPPKGSTAAVSTVALASLDEGRRKEREALIAECTSGAENWVQVALFNAGLWFEATGDLDRAVAAFGEYAKRFAAERDAPDVALAAAAAFERARRSQDAMKQYDAFLTAYAKDPRVSEAKRLDVRYRQFLLVGQRPAEEVERLARELAAGYGRLAGADRETERARLAAAHARFVLLEPRFRAYEELRFRKVGTFKRDREQKEKLLGELERGYAEVLALKDPEFAIAALSRIGLLYAGFAGEIAALPDPPGLDEDQLGMFRSELESRYVFPVEEKAVEAFEKAVAKAAELGLYGEWATLAQDRLNRFKPGSFGVRREVALRGSGWPPALAPWREALPPVEPRAAPRVPERASRRDASSAGERGPGLLQVQLDEVRS